MNVTTAITTTTATINTTYDLYRFHWVDNRANQIKVATAIATGLHRHKSAYRLATEEISEALYLAVFTVQALVAMYRMVQRMDFEIEEAIAPIKLPCELQETEQFPDPWKLPLEPPSTQIAPVAQLMPTPQLFLLEAREVKPAKSKSQPKTLKKPRKPNRSLGQVLRQEAAKM
jgi:hypothetical protein